MAYIVAQYGSDALPRRGNLWIDISACNVTALRLQLVTCSEMRAANYSTFSPTPENPIFQYKPKIFPIWPKPIMCVVRKTCLKMGFLSSDLEEVEFLMYLHLIRVAGTRDCLPKRYFADTNEEQFCVSSAAVHARFYSGQHIENDLQASCSLSGFRHPGFSWLYHGHQACSSFHARKQSF
jgi:hypothetical protein